MLKTYEVMIENGQIKWLKEQPTVKSARAIITLLEDDTIIANQASSSLDNLPELDDLGGSEPQAEAIPRRRFIPSSPTI